MKTSANNLHKSTTQWAALRERVAARKGVHAARMTYRVKRVARNA